MKVLWSWLKEVSGLDVDATEAARRLTLGGLEVESVMPVDEEGQVDSLLEVNVTPNRPDCLSVAGLGRELSALFGRDRPNVHRPRLKEISVCTSSRISVKNLCPRECPRYTGRVVLNVTLGPSPSHIAYRLRQMGLRPINNVVDITNYVLLEMGQPLHAFDLALVEGGSIIICRQAGPGRFITLDGQQRDLAEGDVLISDGARPVALGGIMGGQNTEIGPTTRNVFLESAYFDPGTIRRTSKRLKLQTESSFRFERGVDVDGVPEALDRAAALLQEFGGGEVCAEAVDIFPKPIRRKRIAFNVSAISRHTGVKLSARECEKIFERLGLRVRKRSPKLLDVASPSWRVDLSREIDLVEELIRIHGYDTIPMVLPPTQIRGGGSDAGLALERDIRSILCATGFQEIITPSFAARRSLEAVRTSTRAEAEGMEERPVEIVNPLSEDQQYARPSLLPAWLGVAAHNLKRGRKTIKMFEFGSTYLYKKSNQMVEESAVICAGLSRPGAPARELFLELKGGVETLLTRLGIPSPEFRGDASPNYVPGESVAVCSGEAIIGSLGRVRADILRSFDVESEVFVAEIGERPLRDLWHPLKQTAPFSRHPSVVRDLAVVVDETIPWDWLHRQIVEIRVPQLDGVEPYDEYRGRQVPPGKKSIALHLTFSHPDRTLTEDEVHESLRRLVDALKSKGASLREADSGL